MNPPNTPERAVSLDDVRQWTETEEEAIAVLAWLDGAVSGMTTTNLRAISGELGLQRADLPPRVVVQVHLSASAYYTRAFADPAVRESVLGQLRARLAGSTDASSRYITVTRNPS